MILDTQKIYPSNQEELELFPSYFTIFNDFQNHSWHLLIECEGIAILEMGEYELANGECSEYQVSIYLENGLLILAYPMNWKNHSFYSKPEFRNDDVYWYWKFAKLA